MNLLDSPFFRIPNGSNFAANSTTWAGWSGGFGSGLPTPPIPAGGWGNSGGGATPINPYLPSGLQGGYGGYGAPPFSPTPTTSGLGGDTLGTLGDPIASVSGNNVGFGYNMPPGAAGTSGYGGGRHPYLGAPPPASLLGGDRNSGQFFAPPPPPATGADYTLEQTQAMFNESRATGRPLADPTRPGEPVYLMENQWRALGVEGGRGAGTFDDNGNYHYSLNQENYHYYGEGRGDNGAGGDNRWWIGHDRGGGRRRFLRRVAAAGIRNDSISGYAMNWRMSAG